MYIWLDQKIKFPDVSCADEEGLLALGGDLSVERLLLAYQSSIFPWFTDNEPILWWTPPERYIIRPGKVHISHSMKKFFKKHEVSMEIGRNFLYTMHRCRMKRKNETWITDDMEEAYSNLSKQGYAVGVEAFFDGFLAGGLYGVVIDKCFFGESMFTDISNGSKAALIMLSDLLYQKGFSVIDCQFHTDHLESMGGELITRDEYLEILKTAITTCEKQSIAGKYFLNEKLEVVEAN
ncbi:MAG: leucyl/phenylalanyl-tRNA--protein transferase [Lachnospiraceae bacterium]|nr:leucyl/phenylalanyl-tRNA--protein transferase [Lachnospiraceae bacterium]